MTLTMVVCGTLNFATVEFKYITTKRVILTRPTLDTGFTRVTLEKVLQNLETVTVYLHAMLRTNLL